MTPYAATMADTRPGRHDRRHEHHAGQAGASRRKRKRLRARLREATATPTKFDWRLGGGTLSQRDVASIRHSFLSGRQFADDHPADVSRELIEVLVLAGRNAVTTTAVTAMSAVVSIARYINREVAKEFAALAAMPPPPPNITFAEDWRDARPVDLEFDRWKAARQTADRAETMPKS